MLHVAEPAHKSRRWWTAGVGEYICNYQACFCLAVALAVCTCKLTVVVPATLSSTLQDGERACHTLHGYSHHQHLHSPHAAYTDCAWLAGVCSSQ
jgi:hypothetical protein